MKFLDKKVAGEVFVSSIFDPRDPEYLLVQPDSNGDLLFSQSRFLVVSKEVCEVIADSLLVC